MINVLGVTRARKLAPGLNRIGPSRHAARSYPGFVNWLNSVQPRWHIGLAPLLDWIERYRAFWPERMERLKAVLKGMDQ